MSDIEDYDSEPEQLIDNESDKEELDTSIVSKKTTQTKINAAQINSDDDNDDDDDTDIDGEEDLEDLESLDDLKSEDEEQQGETNKPIGSNVLSPINSDVESDDEDDLQKFDSKDTLEYINKFHPECFTANSDEVEALSQVIREGNKIVDPNHRTNPILTKYEKTKILGQRTKQLNSGCEPYISVPSNIIDNYLIAEMELREKKIPVIIRRPVSNTKIEYWKLQDLEQIY